MITLFSGKTEPVDDSGQPSYSHEIISNSAVGPASLAVEDIDNDGDLDVVSKLGVMIQIIKLRYILMMVMKIFLN